MRVALYGRTSSHEQDKSETIETQRHYLEQWAKSKFLGSGTINAYAQAQGRQPNTIEDSLFLRAFLTSKSPRYVVAGTPPATSPAYTLKADQTRNTTAITGVRVVAGTVCDGTKRLGTTSYYFVPNIGGTVGLYVSCVKVP